MTRPNTHHSAAGRAHAVLAVAVANTGLSLLIEALRGHRGDFWAGWTVEEALGAAGGGVAYLLYFVAAIAALAPVVRHLTRIRPSRGGAAPLAGAIAAVALWSVLLQFWEGAGPARTVAVLGVFVAANGGMGLLTWLGRTGPARAAWWATFAAGLGIAAAVYAAHAAVLHPAIRPERVVAWGAAGVGAGAVVAVAMAIAGRGRAVPRTAAALLLLAVAGAAHQPPVDAQDPRPSLFLITYDALRADWCSPYGGDVPMPALDAIARDGLVFERAYALAPWTLPSMNGLFASQYPPSLTPGATAAQHKDEEVLYGIFASREPMLAESLAALGYTTCALIGNPVLGRSTGLHRGFDHVVTVPSFEGEHRGPLYQLPFLQDAAARLIPALAPRRPVDSTRMLARMGAAFLAEHGRGPFFLWIHFMDPHTTTDPPARHRTMDGPWPWFEPTIPAWGTPQLDKATSTIEPPLDKREKDYVRALYAGEMRYIDEATAELVAALDATGRAADTFLWLSSDHGEEHWDHGRYYHGQTLYDEQVRVPLIVRGPGIAPGRVEGSVSHIDLMPTFAAQLGVDPPPAWRGESLAPVLAGDAAPDRPVFARANNDVVEPAMMVVAGAEKLVEGLESGARELYDLAADPRELENLAGAQPDRADRLAALLAAWRDAVPWRMSDFAADEDPAVSQEVIDALESLGYQ